MTRVNHELLDNKLVEGVWFWYVIILFLFVFEK